MTAQKSQKNSPKSHLKIVSLFSGCGGMDYGATQAGCEVVFANDSSKEAISSLKRLIANGVETFVGACADIRKLPMADIVCGGYPCQSFSMGGVRDPKNDHRSYLYKDFIRALNIVRPKYFVVENVPGLVSLNGGAHFRKQLNELKSAGGGYCISWSKLNSADYGVPQRRKRVFLVGVRRDLEHVYKFPGPTHGAGLLSYVSHGEVIRGLQQYAGGEYYERIANEESNFPWYYMSRNRRAPADMPSFTIVANWRHTPLHPASPVMKMTWSNLSDGWKQRWDFSDEYDGVLPSIGLDPLDRPRRLSWRECSVIQTFPALFEPVGSIEEKFKQIGNAVPPTMAKVIFSGLVDGSGLIPVKKASKIGGMVSRIRRI